MPDTPPPKQLRLLTLAKWALFLVVLAFVVRKADSLWDPAVLTQRPIAWGWLLASGVAYIVGWLPCVWFWQRVMRVLGSDPDWRATLRAYYCGHLGKYAPGKAAVLVVRSGMLKAEGVPVTTAVISITIETLAAMGVGLAIGIALGGYVLPADAWALLPEVMLVLRDQPWLGPLLVVVATVACVTLGAKALVNLAMKLSRVQASDPQQQRDLARVLWNGTYALIPTWLLHGLSLACILIAVDAADWSLKNFLLWTGAIGASSSLGFFVLFAPGGLGVREGILIAALQASVGGPTAVLAAALLRIVWLVAEIISAGILYVLPIMNRKPPG